MRILLPVLTLLLLPACNHMDSNPKKKDEAQQRAREAEVAEDARLPFVPLLSSMEAVDKMSIWEATEKRSIWTPKGDAVFVGGHGVVIDRQEKTLVWVTKEVSKARVEHPARALTEAELAQWDLTLQGINRVEGKHERTCPSTEVDAQEHIELQRGDKRETILNYRRAECRASYTDSVAFQKLAGLMKSFGAPW